MVEVAISAAWNTKVAPVNGESCAASMMADIWICRKMGLQTRSPCGVLGPLEEWEVDVIVSNLQMFWDILTDPFSGFYCTGCTVIMSCYELLTAWCIHIFELWSTVAHTAKLDLWLVLEKGFRFFKILLSMPSKCCHLQVITASTTDVSEVFTPVPLRWSLGIRGRSRSSGVRSRHRGHHLVGGLEHLLFFHILGIIIPID